MMDLGIGFSLRFSLDEEDTRQAPLSAKGASSSREHDEERF